MENHNRKQDVKIAKIEKDVSWIRERLNHVGDKMEKIENKLLWGFLFGIIILVITQVIVKVFL